jgi:hypothetical protein
MMLEEFRMHSAMVGKVQFLFFPVMIAIFALVFSAASTLILQTIPLDRVYLILHIVMVAYGLGVGGFALFGEQIGERRFGQIDLLLTTPMRHPIDFKSTFLAFYVKDVIYYIFFSILPLILGIGLSVPLTSFKVTSVLFLFLTLVLSFILGISFSFFLSTIYVRSRILFGLVGAAVASIFLGSLVTSYYNMQNLIPTLMFQYTSNPMYFGIALISILAFSFIAVNFIKIEFGKKTERYPSEIIETRDKFKFIGNHSTLAAKEWVDMKRGGTLYPIMGAYVGPLIFLALMVWLLQTLLLIPIDFNIVFYAGMMGLFGVTIYSWLNLGEADFYQILPVTVPRLIKTKLLLFAMLTFGTSTAFLVVLGILNLELHLIWLALTVAFTTTPYAVIVTAYLTGLRTNAYLFDARVLAKFTAMIAPPLIFIIIAALSLANSYFTSVVLILFISAILLAVMVLLYRGIDKKWAKEGFAF